MRRHLFTFTLCLSLALAGCDQLGIESGPATLARREAEGKAVGAGCRHAVRSVEQCYQLNKRADKAAVFAGWREMNDYMRENKVEGIPPEKPTEMAEADTAADATTGAPSGKAPTKKH
jgi:hypothetical protein